MSGATLARVLADRLSGAAASTLLADLEGPADGVAERVSVRRRQLSGLGLVPGDRVLVGGGRGLAFWIDLAACWTGGLVVVPVDSRVRKDRLDAMVGAAEPAALLCETGSPLEALALPRPDGSGSGAAEASAATEVAPDALAAILFTSGSTGDAKGVPLSHGQMLGNSRGTLGRIDLRPGDRLFVAVPFHFTSAICHFVAAVVSGATLVATEAKLAAADLNAALRATRATAFGGAPLQLRWLAESCRDAPVPLRWAMSSGDHLDTEVIRSFRDRLPECAVYTVYGLTEVAGRLCVLDPERIDSDAGSVGRPIDGLSVRVELEDGRPAATGQVGEVVVSGPLVFPGYLGHPPQVGPFRTGDVGRLDASGLLWLEGRRDDVFKCAGQKVSPERVARALQATGAFEDVAVVAWRHPSLGQVPVALYVPRRDRPFERGAVLGRLRGELPGSHIPQRFESVEALPRTGSGKLDRRALRGLVADLGLA